MELSVSKVPWYGQVGAFFAVSGLLLAAFSRLYAMPAHADLTNRQASLETLRADIRKGLVTARQLAVFQTRVATLARRVESLGAALPEQKDVGGLLRRIQTLATQSNLTIQAFKPQPTTTKQLHAEWPIVLELDGTYHNLGKFLDKISKLSRIMSITTLDIKAKDKPDENSTITALCLATTFVMLETAGSSTTAPTSGAIIDLAAATARSAAGEIQSASASSSVRQTDHAREARAEPEDYTYDSAGRRDPFVSLRNREADVRSARRPEGLAGVLVGEMVIRGIVRSRGSYVAVVQAADSKSYVIHPNDLLFDGAVKSITSDAVVLLQEVDDALSLVRRREVRKPLRPIEEQK